MNPVSFALLRRWVDVPAVGLPSLILGRRVAPELLQSALTPAAVAAAVASRLDDAGAREAARADAEALATQLGPPGAADRAAETLLDPDRGFGLRRPPS